MTIVLLRKPDRLTGTLGALLIAGCASALLGVPALAAMAENYDSRSHLSQLERERSKIHEQKLLLQHKHQLAMVQVRKLRDKLNSTTHELANKKHALKSTEQSIHVVESNINETKTTSQQLGEQAAERLKEIYEGQRLNFVEMLFQVDSLQTLLDHFYFQERIADADKNLLAQLKERAETLEQNKTKLGEKKNALGDIVSEIAQKAIAIAKEKFNQEEVADKLKKQKDFYEQAEKQLAQESQRLETQIMEMETSHRHGSGKMVSGSGSLAMPLHAQITSPFGWRNHPIFGVRKFHTGIDLAGPNHSSIRVADDGNVLYTGWYGGYGKVVIVSHGKGMATLYAHLSKISVEPGQNVNKGDVLAYEGTTGFSTGPHLHFEVRMNGKPNNPLNYLR